MNLRPRRDDFLGSLLMDLRREHGNYIIAGSEMPVLDLRPHGRGGVGLGDTLGSVYGLATFSLIAGSLFYLWATRKAGSERPIRNPKRTAMEYARQRRSR